MKQIVLSKDSLSKYLFLTFFMMVLIFTGYNHLFTTKQRNQVVPSALSNPLAENFLTSLSQIKIKNQRLQVTMDLKGETWLLSKPKKFPLQEELASKIKDTLKQIKITKIYPDDALNRETFRLVQGLSSISLTTKEESLKILFGLNNSVDRTSYIRIENQKAIFQIETLPMDFSNIVLNDLININLYPYTEVALSEVYINKGSQTKWHRMGILKNSEGKWQNTYNRVLNPDKVQAYLKKLSSIRFSHLIDEREQDLEEKLERIFRYPSYNLSFKLRGKTINSIISRPITYDISSLNIPKDRFVMIKFDNTPLLYLMPKKNLNFLEQKKTKDLR